MLRCPGCAAPIPVEVKVTLSIGWWDALRCRLAKVRREQIVRELLDRLQVQADDAIFWPVPLPADAHARGLLCPACWDRHCQICAGRRSL